VTKIITLKSFDEKEFTVPEAVVKQSQAIRCLLEDGHAQNVLLLHTINARLLEMLINYY
jgi:Skp1 family, tetramerisation domain